MFTNKSVRTTLRRWQTGGRTNLLFQPPHTPEVNPIERLWKEIKKTLKWECFQSSLYLCQARTTEIYSSATQTWQTD
ncbi:MAG: transposase [Brasilonema angustatum HA4187-MV1]|nr:transposase [Brasilonema angustatum HA4187-MV1]